MSEEQFVEFAKVYTIIIITLLLLSSRPVLVSYPHLALITYYYQYQPYADRIAVYLKERHPTVPVVYFANGGSGYLHRQKDMHVDGLSIDWKLSMARAREVGT